MKWFDDIHPDDKVFLTIMAITAFPISLLLVGKVLVAVIHAVNGTGPTDILN